MSVVHDSVFYETSSYSFKGPRAFLILVRKVLRSSEKGRLVLALPALELSYLLIWTFCSSFDAPIGLTKDGITCTLPLSDESLISPITFSLKLTRESSRPEVMSVAASLTCSPKATILPTFHACILKREEQLNTAQGINEPLENSVCSENKSVHLSLLTGALASQSHDVL